VPLQGVVQGRPQLELSSANLPTQRRPAEAKAKAWDWAWARERRRCGEEEESTEGIDEAEPADGGAVLQAQSVLLPSPKRLHV
jgi:hypothetical protein